MMQATELFSLQSKVALVTGASTGLGQAIAIALANAGADIAGVARSDVRETRERVIAYGRRFHEINTDLSDSRQARGIVTETVRALGRIDILVNNAGIIRRNDALSFTEEEWDA